MNQFNFKNLLKSNTKINFTNFFDYFPKPLHKEGYMLFCDFNERFCDLLIK